MPFPLNVYFVAAAAAFFTTLCALPFWRHWCERTGLVDDPGHRKIHQQPIPLAGGLAVLTGFLLPILAAVVALWLRKHGGPAGEAAAALIRAGQADTTVMLRHGLNVRSLQLAGILLGAIGMVMVGILDDRHELSAWMKFGGQLLIAALVAATGVRITLFVPSVAFSYAVTILWILAVINALNFLDNMNGLCAGVGAMGALSFALISAHAGQYLVAIIAFLTLGALLGFLPYNFPKARAFLGDSGSHLIGYLLALLAILPHFYSAKHTRRAAVFIPLLVLAVPLLDMARVVIWRWRKGQPFYVGDTNHISHILVRRGFSPVQAVLLLWGTAALGGAAAWMLVD